MKTQIRQEGETLIVTVQGKLDYEGQIPFREKLNALLTSEVPTPKTTVVPSYENRFANRRGHRIASTDETPKRPHYSEVVINLENLEFVGSCGISQFIQTLKEFNSRSDIRPKYLHVRNEFKRMIRAFDEAAGFDFQDPLTTPQKPAEHTATETQSSIPVFGPKKIREQ